MKLPTRDHTVIIENMVTELCDHIDHKYGLDPETRDALHQSPSAALLDRVMAFRVEPWYHDVRAALERIETNQFGKCVCCGELIPMQRLLETPTARLCERCAQQTAMTHPPGPAMRRKEKAKAPVRRAGPN